MLGKFMATVLTRGTSAAIVAQRCVPLPLQHTKSAPYNTSKIREVHHPKSARWQINTRTLILALASALAFLMADPPSAAAQQCEVRCFHDCWMTPRGRCCGRRCVRHCYAPRYVPPSSYQYAPPTSQLDPATVGLGVFGIIVVAVVVAAALVRSSAATDELVGDTNRLHQYTTNIRAAAQDTRAKIHSINDAIEREAAAAYERGRARADAVWRHRAGDPHG